MKRLALILLLAAACSRRETAVHVQAKALPTTGGNAARGREAIDRYGCTACHEIPGIAGPKGMVAPSLAHIASRPTIGSARLPNRPETLIKWLQDPQALDPQTGMPNMGVTGPDARDIAAYLYTLK